MLLSSHCGKAVLTVPTAASRCSRRPVKIVAFKEEDKAETVNKQRVKEAVKQASASFRPASDHVGTSSRPASAKAPIPTPELFPTKQPAFEAPLSVPVFSRRREVALGRLAMGGFYASCMMESFLMGPGPVSQLSILSGLPPLLVEAVLAGFVLHGVWGLSPTTPTWSKQNRRDALLRPKGPPRAFVNPFSSPDKFFGFAPFEWGFLKRNELLAGRLAMLGFLGTCLAEPVARGKGALGQIAWWTHIPAGQAYYQLCNFLLVVVPVVFGVLAYLNKHPFEVKGSDDIYS